MSGIIDGAGPGPDGQHDRCSSTKLESLGMTLEEPLFALSVAYAQAADRRDADAYGAVFEYDGTLRLCETANPAVIAHSLRGHSQKVLHHD